MEFRGRDQGSALGFNVVEAFNAFIWSRGSLGMLDYATIYVGKNVDPYTCISWHDAWHDAAPDYAIIYVRNNVDPSTCISLSSDGGSALCQATEFMEIS